MAPLSTPGHPSDPLPFIREYLHLAIRIGAPAYSVGDHRGCYEVYACTARLLLSSVQGADEARQTLREALHQCSTEVDVNEQAWAMRRAFDAILGEAGGP
jgi:hypothetical protein